MINALRLLQLLPLGRQLNSLPNPNALQRRVFFLGQRLVGSLLSAGLVLGSLLGLSAAAVAEEEEAVIEEVVVTGSRLTTNPNLASAVPVLTVTGDEGVMRGNIRIEDFVNVLPQVFAGQASEVSNGASGTASLNLRGLEARRTLVLIDGKRLPYGSSQTSATNLDLVPMQLVQQVDILTGGASAVYGSDAVGGVANFILQKDFEGVQIGGQFARHYAENDSSRAQGILRAASQPVPGSGTDGEETQFFAKLGVNFDDGRGNATLFFSYEDRDSILQADRDFSGCALGQDDGPNSFAGLGCVGSANFRLFGGPGGFAFQEENGNIIDFAGGPTQTFNFGPTNFFQRPAERYHFYAKSHYDLNDNVEAFFDFTFINNVSDAQIAPSASFGIGAYSINCNNPFIQGNSGVSFATIFGCDAAAIAAGTVVDGITASHRNVEGGSRNSRLENSTWRGVGGLRGSFADDVWQWETFIQKSETRDQSISTNDFVVANLQQALLVTTDANGNAVCTDTTGGCVPYNIFQRGSNGETRVTQAALDFIQGIGLVNGSTAQLVFGGNIQADLDAYDISMPWTDAGVGVLFGFEYREDQLDAIPDQISQVPGGGFTGVGGATLPVSGAVEVTEFYTEFEVPILTERTYAKELTLRGQYRISDYDAAGNNTSNSFDTDAYGVSLAWAPIDDLRFRAQYQRAVRAPNVIELYEGQNTDLPNLTAAGTNTNNVQLFDPCASNAPIESLANCQRTGVTAAQYGTILDVISGQTQSLTGGNTNLNPEEADTVTVGFVYTPAFVEDLTISVDYFDIVVEDAIEDGIPAQTTLSQCLATGSAVFCDLITRATSGTLAAGTSGVGFQQTNINIGELETQGIDLQVGYAFEIGVHGISLDYAATFLDTYNKVPFPGADPIVCAGKFGNSCERPFSEYRHRAKVTWTNPWAVDVVGTWRFFDETGIDNTTEQLETKLDSVNYFDVAASYSPIEDLTLRASVLNLFNETPPIFSSAGPALGNGNTYPTVYDISTTMVVSFEYNL